MARPDKPVHIPLGFEEALSDLLKVNPDEPGAAEDDRVPVRIRLDHAPDDKRDLVGFPRDWAEKDKRFKWAWSYEATEDVQEPQRVDGYMYVPASEWDRRQT
ncbi:MAG TPA: hypothetical protein VMS74_08115 [Acidimicrobiia bacterium]|nr:hypothetical protein [Acidimicrobiia bacterium]